MARKIKPVQHEDQLTLVEHLDELRSRLIVSAIAFVVAMVLAFWQNHVILQIFNNPLDGKEPVSLGVTEQLTTTLTLSAYAAIMLALPVILYQLYAFILPAFSREEKRVALPLLLMVPLLFIGGVVFAYFVVLPPALTFLLGFNADEFNTLVRASEYYSFVSLLLIALGILFQIPVGILALSKLGVVTPQQLRKNRRYAILAIAVLAALLPSADPVTMLLIMVPLVILYEGSILLAAAFGAPSGALGDRLASAESS